jgi:hypothetical protein
LRNAKKEKFQRPSSKLQRIFNPQSSKFQCFRHSRAYYLGFGGLEFGISAFKAAGSIPAGDAPFAPVAQKEKFQQPSSKLQGIFNPSNFKSQMIRRLAGLLFGIWCLGFGTSAFKAVRLHSRRGRAPFAPVAKGEAPKTKFQAPNRTQSSDNYWQLTATTVPVPA